VMQQAGGSLGSFVTGLVPHQGAANLAWLMLFWASCGWLALLRLHHVQRSAAVPQGAR